MKPIKQIYKEIKKANTIVIARHIGPDPDAIGAQIALREILKHHFPKKNIYALGTNVKKLSYLGEMDRVFEDDIEHDLLIVLDTPNISRIEGINIELYKQVIKIDHHPFIEDFNGIEWIEEHANSTCEMLIEFIFKLKLKLNEHIATNLFVGVMADTNRFLYLTDSYYTIELVYKLLEKQPLPLPEIYPLMYTRSIEEWRFQGYLINNIEFTKHKVGYIFLDDATLKEYKVDAGSAGNMINGFNNLDGVPIIVFFSEDTKNKIIRVSSRSKEIPINRILESYGGGGHKLAAGARISDQKDIKKIIEDFEKAAKQANLELNK